MNRKLAAIVGTGRALVREWRLPRLAKQERDRDQSTPLDRDPGSDVAVRDALEWLRRAQDHNLRHDGGVARHFSVLDGWSESYPETTGYIVPTFLDCATRLGDDDLRQRARRMLDWLVSIQMPGGGFQGGTIGATPRVPVTFNTGQILLGLAAGAREFGDAYREPMRRAADWLATTQDADGCWRAHQTPFARPGEKAYETHVAWGVIEAARVEPNDRWIEAAVRQVRWATSRQRENGWFADNDLTDSARPLTHTIGYVLRGVIEAYRFSGNDALLDAAIRCAQGARSALAPDGRLPGRLDAEWKPAAAWVCLTGASQIAHCWLQLFQITGESGYRDAAARTLAFVRRTVRRSGEAGVVGGVKGSLPIDGDYCRYELPNWAAKFFIDANLLERDIAAAPSAAAPIPRLQPRQ